MVDVMGGATTSAAPAMPLGPESDPQRVPGDVAELLRRAAATALPTAAADEQLYEVDGSRLAPLAAELRAAGWRFALHVGIDERGERGEGRDSGRGAGFGVEAAEGAGFSVEVTFARRDAPLLR